ncbi:MAG: hypothetical protein AAB373_06405, partial [Patescibacteria group bacterium]
MLDFYKNINLFKSSRLVFGHETPDGLPENTAAKSRQETVHEIAKTVQQERQALMSKQETDLTIDTDRRDKGHLLKESATILISQNGTGSKHNSVGWRGLALPTDSIKILSKNITNIKGKEYVKVRVKHEIPSKGENKKYRIYVGYIEKSAFK